MATTTNSTGYGPRRGLLFDGNESKYELWEVKFLGYMRLQKLYNVFVRDASEKDPPDESKRADAFAELVQCLDDRSLSLVIRDARDDGRRALEILREHYQGKGKPRIITLYTELTSLKKQENETIVDYVIRAERSATALREADEVISDALLIAMVLKGLPSEYNTFATVVVQREKQMNFAEFKSALRSHEESAKTQSVKTVDTGDNIMVTKQKFDGNCFKCGRKGHKSSECWSKSEKWCNNCKNKSHETKNCRKKKDAAKTAAGKTTPRENNEHTFAFVSKDTNSNSGIPIKNNSSLLVDTGATSHIINDKSKFVDFDKEFNPSAHVIELADGSKANVVLGKGNAKVKLYDVNGNARDVMLNSALYVPSYEQNIFSVHAAIERGAIINLDREAKQLKCPDGTTFEMEQKGRLYYLNSISSSKNNACSLHEWHKILGHCNYGDVQKLQNVVEGMNISTYDEIECKVCTEGKMCQFRNRSPDERATAPLDFVHCDLAGPIDPVARDGFKYTLSFVDDYSGTIMIYFLKCKSDAPEALQQFLADTAPFGRVKRIRSDNGTEFTSQKFKSILRENRIRHETSAPYSPHQNGTVERAWLSLFNMARCLLLEAKLPKSMWTYAVMAAAYIRNRCFNVRLGKTPYEAFTGSKPNLSNMHVFGSVCYAYVQNAKKLDPRSKQGIFVGYDKGSPAYLVFHPDSNKVERVRCVKFFGESNHESKVDLDDHEGELPPSNVNVPIANDSTIPAQGDESANSTESVVDETRYPTRTRTKPTYLNEYVTGKVVDDTTACAVDYCYRTYDIPTSYSQAIHSPEGSKWEKAMNDEIEALERNETFELVPPPKGREVVGGKWVYAVKTGPNKAETHKARYVAKGYSQIPGIDYHETFSPTARMSSIRVLVQHATQKDMLVHQMDVKTAYLNAPIDCEIFMEQPEGYERVGQNGERLVCKLRKSLYGLKQSGRNWNNMLHDYLLKQNFTQSLADPCVYIRKSGTDECTIVIIWVDDLIISASNEILLQSVKDSLSNTFRMKDLGVLSWFLGTEFKCLGDAIEMSQKQYIEKLLGKFGMAESKPKVTPTVLGLDKFVDMESPELKDPTLYRAIVGSLIYVMTGTRPDLCYIVTKLSQNMAKPTEANLNAAKHVLRFLKGTTEQSLRFTKSETTLKLIGFCDSDWGGDVCDRRSISGYGFQLLDEGPLVSWRSRKQPTVALSTCEAEYMALTDAVQEAKFLKQLCVDLGIVQVSFSVILNVDNQGAINLAKNPMYHKRSKHIDVKYHFIRSEVSRGTVKLVYIPTNENVADIFTKPVSKVKLDTFGPFISGKYHSA